MTYPDKIFHWINNKEAPPESGEYFPKYNPANGEEMSQVARGNRDDVQTAVGLAKDSLGKWSSVSVVTRSEILRAATQIIQARRQEIAEILAVEAGKSVKESLGEIGAAVEMGFFVAGEGRRFYGHTTTSGVPNRFAMTVRQPVGVCALITPFNNPFAAIAWKVFPALLCGNTAILKPSENTPYTAILFAKILKEAGLPAGVFSVIEGDSRTGAALVENLRVDLISFTGSVAAGKQIQKAAAERLAKVCLEMGGKNALVVCDDADLKAAAESAVLSAFNGAGQRCAAGSRIIVFGAVYDEFKKLTIEITKNLKIGVDDADDVGPVINEKQLNGVAQAVEMATGRGAAVLAGGRRLEGGKYKKGYYFEPTILENISPKDELSRTEIFGPLTILYWVKNFEEALDLVNDTPFGLTAAIHTKSIHRSQVFQERCRAGVISVNGLTYGSEPHMPFGGLKNSGTGWREAGTEALDVYSEWKTIYIKHNPDLV